MLRAPFPHLCADNAAQSAFITLAVIIHIHFIYEEKKVEKNVRIQAEEGDDLTTT